MSNYVADIGVEGENNLDEMVSGLYRRVTEETEKRLESQLKKLGVDIDNFKENAGTVSRHIKKAYYPNDDHALATYHYDGQFILGVRISDNFMAIEFDVPNLATQKRRGSKVSKFKDKIVLFSGGINEYVGEIVPCNHGSGWWRIKNPCTITPTVDPQTKQRVNQIISFHYPQRNYKKWVDIYIPPDSIIEVRTLDKEGHLYREYKKAINQVASDRIHLVGGVDTIQ